MTWCFYLGGGNSATHGPMSLGGKPILGYGPIGYPWRNLKGLTNLHHHEGNHLLLDIGKIPPKRILMKTLDAGPDTIFLKVLHHLELVFSRERFKRNIMGLLKLWVSGSRERYQLYPQILREGSSPSTFPPPHRSWFNKGQTVHHSTGIDFLKPTNAARQLQLQCPRCYFHPTHLTRSTKERWRQRFGSVAGNEKVVGFFPPFSTKGWGKGLEIHMFFEDICRCQSKDWKISWLYSWHANMFHDRKRKLSWRREFGEQNPTSNIS